MCFSAITLNTGHWIGLLDAIRCTDVFSLQLILDGSECPLNVILFFSPALKPQLQRIGHRWRHHPSSHWRSARTLRDTYGGFSSCTCLWKTTQSQTHIEEEYADAHFLSILANQTWKKSSRAYSSATAHSASRNFTASSTASLFHIMMLVAVCLKMCLYVSFSTLSHL